MDAERILSNPVINAEVSMAALLLRESEVGVFRQAVSTTLDSIDVVSTTGDIFNPGLTQHHELTIAQGVIWGSLHTLVAVRGASHV